MRFIEKYPQRASPLTLVLNEDKEFPPEHDHSAMNFSLTTEWREDVAAGRCSIYREPDGSDYMLISALYVEGNENNPTKNNPNQYVGLGQLLVFAAMKFGYEQNVRTTLLSPLTGSEGFYIKMGFYPKVTGNPNRMTNASHLPLSHRGKLNPKWVGQFAQASFINKDFRGSTWAGSTPLIYLKLKENIMKAWAIG
ncbi:hypothetical protein N5D52_20905 [Pseudomonas sp. GD03860]|uniref:hypothetical protein n=1 Tax=Pseudomonas TaxID=286 RepID=UPI002363DE3E|nr:MULTISPECIES: hypothetical protein [Pseudomonas]MDD2059029.1 hypothetical protein [Pseudomonas putida]MDH0639394.1 hypothetical protein [Pseudomonas sp. GD03860]